MTTKFFALLICFSLALHLNAQTKKIAHKRHSGNEATFLIALKTNDFVIANSNFGLAPGMEYMGKTLDSVISISDSTTVFVTHQTWPLTNNSSNDTLVQIRDTIYSAQIISPTMSLDSVKTIINRDFYFYIPTDTVKYIGF
ncbi:MAG: hypothetical protein ACHQFW_11215, partial [Chitinophagales bacterium]